MKKLFIAVVIASSLTACRETTAETMENEAMPQFKKTENATKKTADSVGPVVVIPPKITGSTTSTGTSTTTTGTTGSTEPKTTP